MRSRMGFGKIQILNDQTDPGMETAKNKQTAATTATKESKEGKIKTKV